MSPQRETHTTQVNLRWEVKASGVVLERKSGVIYRIWTGTCDLSRTGDSVEDFYLTAITWPSSFNGSHIPNTLSFKYQIITYLVYSDLTGKRVCSHELGHDTLYPRRDRSHPAGDWVDRKL